MLNKEIKYRRPRNPKVNLRSQLGYLYVKCTKRNLFSTLIDAITNKIKTSCSLRVPFYETKYNQRENLKTRGVLLGKLFGEKTIQLGYTKLMVFLTGKIRGRLDFVRTLSRAGIQIKSIVLVGRSPHNGCRPAKARRKKFRSKPKRIK